MQLKDQSCAFNTKNVGALISNYYSGSNGEVKMAQALDSIGPLSIALNANILQSYSSGIINSASCSKSINHAVLLVGYGTDNGFDYWIAKNSWGPIWGSFNDFIQF